MVTKKTSGDPAAQEAEASVVQEALKSGMAVPAAIMAGALRFSASRLLAQADHLLRLSACRDLAEASRLQREFLASSLESYKDEASLVAERLHIGRKAS